MASSVLVLCPPLVHSALKDSCLSVWLLKTGEESFCLLTSGYRKVLEIPAFRAEEISQ